MKKLAVILSLLFLSSSVVFADEVLPQQDIKNDQAYGTLNIQKQPQEGKQKQGITNHFTFFTINVQVNGKINDIDPSNK